MANGYGGPRRPTSPAPVSGPGRLSQRTDGGPGQPVRDVTGLAYGEGSALSAVQAAAPMANGGVAPTAMPDVGLGDMSPNLHDPSNQPDTSVFNGMPFGPGAGPEALATPTPNGPSRARLMTALPTLLRAAESPDVTPEFRSMVALLRQAALG